MTGRWSLNYRRRIKGTYNLIEEGYTLGICIIVSATVDWPNPIQLHCNSSLWVATQYYFPSLLVEVLNKVLPNPPGLQWQFPLLMYVGPHCVTGAPKWSTPTPHHATFNSPHDIPSTTPRFGLQVINFLHLTKAFLVSTATLKTNMPITIEY